MRKPSKTYEYDSHNKLRTERYCEYAINEIFYINRY